MIYPISDNLIKFNKKHLIWYNGIVKRNQKSIWGVFYILDNIIVKKLGIITDKIDLEKSYISYDSNTNYNIIEMYLKKEDEIICPIFGSTNIIIRGTKCNVIKTTMQNMQNIIMNIHRRQYKCSCGRVFLQEKLR